MSVCLSYIVMATPVIDWLWRYSIFECQYVFSFFQDYRSATIHIYYILQHLYNGIGFRLKIAFSSFRFEFFFSLSAVKWLHTYIFINTGNLLFLFHIQMNGNKFYTDWLSVCCYYSILIGSDQINESLHVFSTITLIFQSQPIRSFDLQFIC